MELGPQIFILRDLIRMYSTNKVVVKLYDKDSTFKRTLSGTYLSTFPSFTETLGY